MSWRFCVDGCCLILALALDRPRRETSPRHITQDFQSKDSSKCHTFRLSITPDSQITPEYLEIRDLLHVEQRYTELFIEVPI